MIPGRWETNKGRTACAQLTARDGELLGDAVDYQNGGDRLETVRGDQGGNSWQDRVLERRECGIFREPLKYSTESWSGQACEGTTQLGS